MALSKMQKNVIYAVLIYGLAFLLFIFDAMAAKKDEKIIICDEAKAKLVRVPLGRLTLLNFPGTPKDILPGENVFDFNKIKNDLTIKALKPNAKTNVFVYMKERRCAFNLVTVTSGGDDILFVRDPKDQQIEVKFHE